MAEVQFRTYEPVPDGTYQLRVNRCEERESTRDGGIYLQWELEVINHSGFVGKKLNLNTSLNFSINSKAYSFFRACGMPELSKDVKLDTNSFIGQTIVAFITQGTNTKGTRINVFQSFQSLAQYTASAAAFGIGGQAGMLQPAVSYMPLPQQPQDMQPPVMQPQDMQPPVMQPPVMQPPVMQPQDMQPPVMQPQDMQAQTMQPQTMQPPVMQPQGMQPQGMQAQTMQPQGMQAQTMQPPVMQPQGMQPQGMQAQTMQPQGMQAQTMQPPVMQAQTMQAQVRQAQVRQAQGRQAQVRQAQGRQAQVFDEMSEDGLKFPDDDDNESAT